MLQKMRVFCVIYGLIALGLGCANSRTAEADEIPSLPPYFTKLQLPAGRAELSNGFDVTANGWGGYSTAVVALGGPLHADGWRLKLSGGYSSYHYKNRSAYCQLSAEEKRRRPGGNFGAVCNDIAGNPPEGEERAALAADLAAAGLELEGDQIYAVVPHQGTRYDAAIAPGYQFTRGAVILKTYVGLGYELHEATPPDATNLLGGSYWGAQAGLEAWVTLGEDFWISADASYFSGTNAHAASMKMGYKAQPWLSLGPEFSTYGNVDDTSGRAGAFLRLDALGVDPGRRPVRDLQGRSRRLWLCQHLYEILSRWPRKGRSAMRDLAHCGSIRQSASCPLSYRTAPAGRSYGVIRLGDPLSNPRGGGAPVTD